MQAVFTGLVPGQMLAGVASGGVYKSSDGGTTWKPPAPDNGMARSESVWSLGSYKDGLIYAATQSGIYISTDFGSNWTLSNDGISGITLRTFADDKCPNIYYASGTDGVFRSINAGLTWSNIEGPTGKQLGGGQVRELIAVQRHQREAPLRGHRERRVRRPHRASARCPARSPGARSPTPASATTRSSGRSTSPDPRHVRRRHAVQRRLPAGLRAAATRQAATPT